MTETTVNNIGFSRKKRILCAAIFILLSIAMLVYGAAFHSIGVAVKQLEEDSKGERQELILSELAITRDITVGGLERLADGIILRTYSGDKPPESACPT